MSRMDMNWGKLKKLIEQNFCDSLRKRVRINLTNYRAQHEPETRIWFTFDGEEIYSISKLQWINEHYKLTTEIREINQCTNFTKPEQEPGYNQAFDQAEEILQRRGMFSEEFFTDYLMKYLSLPFNEALKSNEIIIKALTMIDKRLGKRRLKDIRLLKIDHILIKKLYEIRCEVESIPVIIG